MKDIPFIAFILGVCFVSAIACIATKSLWGLLPMLFLIGVSIK